MLGKINLRKWIAPALLVALLGLAAVLPLPWNPAAEDAGTDLLFRLRSPRALPGDIVFVTLGDEDIRALGEWPISRDYYGYMTHILTQLGAKTIGFDLLFDTPNRQFPENDRLLAEFFQSSNRVVLPMVFGEVGEPGAAHARRWPLVLPAGKQPTWPIPELARHAAAIGFSNLGEASVIRRLPLVLAEGDSFRLSFAAELARHFLGYTAPPQLTRQGLVLRHPEGSRRIIPLDATGRLRLDYPAVETAFRRFSFVSLLRAFETAPDSLDFTGKLVIIGMASPAVAQLKSTPLASNLPATLLHAVAAENIIQGNFLRQAPAWLRWLILTAVVLGLWLIWRLGKPVWRWGLSLGLLAGYWLAAALTFAAADFILPLFYPTLAIFLGLVYLNWQNARQKQHAGDLLHDELQRKQQQLQETEQQLAELERKLRAEATEKAELSEQTQEMAREKQEAIRMLEKHIRDLQAYAGPEPAAAEHEFSEIVHAPDSKIVRILDLVRKVAADDIPVIILGDTGTGKELIARAIHRASPRHKQPFVAINCGALPETLLESELFGHEKGSFTGAVARRRGRFELADGGTIFLDEITETAPAFQARILRVLQEGVFERLGGEKSLRVDVRLIAATNKDLKQQVQRHAFRADLYYRLNGFTIHLPPLQQRQSDIPVLARHLLQKHGFHGITGFSEQAMQRLQQYAWPGNVRELENAVRRAAILAQGDGRDLIRAGDLPEEIESGGSGLLPEGIVLQPLDEQILTLLRALKFSRASITQTARALGNRDRGTVTEYFRGLCFQALVHCDYELDRAARELAGTEDAEVIARVRRKLQDYVQNVQSSAVGVNISERPAVFKGLPKKYHPYLQSLLENLHRIR